jgi:hypothetical protein
MVAIFNELKVLETNFIKKGIQLRQLTGIDTMGFNEMLSYPNEYDNAYFIKLIENYEKAE